MTSGVFTLKNMRKAVLFLFIAIGGNNGLSDGWYVEGGFLKYQKDLQMINVKP